MGLLFASRSRLFLLHFDLNYFHCPSTAAFILGLDFIPFCTYASALICEPRQSHAVKMAFGGGSSGFSFGQNNSNSTGFAGFGSAQNNTPGTLQSTACSFITGFPLCEVELTSCLCKRLDQAPRMRTALEVRRMRIPSPQVRLHSVRIREVRGTLKAVACDCL